MVSKSTQTKADRPDLERDILRTTMGEDNLGMDCEDARTVQREIMAEISNHMVLAKNSCMEPLITMRGLSSVGIFRFFLRFTENVLKDGATEWVVDTPMDLLPLLRVERWHQMGWGPSKLHVRSKEIQGKRILLAQPPFKAWFKRCPRGRTTLIVTFKLWTMDDAGNLTPPPNIACSDEDTLATQSMAVKVLTQMAERKMPLSAQFLDLIGRTQDARRAAQRLAEWEVQRKLAKSTKRSLELDLSTGDAMQLGSEAESAPPSTVPSAPGSPSITIAATTP